VYIGVTVIVATFGWAVLLVSVNGAIELEVFEATKLILGSELVQVKVVPGTLPTNAIFGVCDPAQRTIDCIGATVGIGLTVIVMTSVD
jgi:hypothetical protein